jgi:hypothetical protein
MPQIVIGIDYSTQSMLTPAYRGLSVIYFRLPLRGVLGLTVAGEVAPKRLACGVTLGVAHFWVIFTTLPHDFLESIRMAR